MIRPMLSLEEKVQLLGRAGIFESLSPNLLAQVAARAGENDVADGALLFREGSPGDTIYFILKGSVEIFRESADGKPIALATLQEGEVFGEMAALGGGRRTASARARGALKLLFIKARALKTLISKVPNFGFGIFQILVERLIDANERILSGRAAAPASRTPSSISLGPAASAGLSEANRRYLGALRSEGWVADADLAPVLKELRASPPTPLGDVLMKRGLLTEAQHQKIVRALNKEEAASRDETPLPADAVDCPNCFEQIQRKSYSCRFCGVQLQKVELTVSCPQCGHSQPPQGRFCRACGVDLKTGRLPGRPEKRPCPRCGLTSSGSETICVVCGTAFDRSPVLVRVQDALGSVFVFARAHVGKVVFLAILAGLGWVWLNRDRLSRELQGALYGREIADARRAAEEIVRFIPYRDAASIHARMTPEARRRLEQGGEKELAALWGRQSDTETLVSLDVQDVQSDDVRQRVYLKATVRLPPDGSPAPVDPSGVIGKGFQELLAPKGKSLERFLIWEFVEGGKLDSAQAGQQR
jgi:CRP-like cAMP-binding protein